MHWCKNCVTPSTRPRVQFTDGVCNACHHHEQKQKIDWSDKRAELMKLCDGYRRKGGFDVIVPCSGGKDGSVVAHKLKHEYGMTPLCITFVPQMQTWLGNRNLDNFRNSGFNHITITPDSDVYRQYSKDWFLKMGLPKQPFVVGISTSILQYAGRYNIPFIMYGEQGEQEYGGESKHVEKFDRDFLINIYYEGQDPTKYGGMWKFPKQHKLDMLYATWWSLFAAWDPEYNARYAKENCGLQMMVGGSIGTFTNYSQLDDVMQDLHAYLMYVKHGFGRCTSDASIEIRHGRMTREEGVKVVNKLDGQFPVELLDCYLDYFEMTEPEFWAVIDKFANKKLLKKTGQSERPYVLKKEVE